MNRITLAGIALGLLMHGQTLCAQNTTAAGDWSAERERKAESLQPEKITGFDKILGKFKKGANGELDLGIAGLYPKIGGVAPGSGFGLGAEYRPTNLAGGQVELKLSARATLLKYKRYEAGIGLPKLAGGLLSLEFNGTHRDHPREDFFGLGAESSVENRTNYHLKDTTLSGALKLHPASWLTAGVRGGLLDTAASHGADPRFRSTEEVFPEFETPGVQTRARFRTVSAFVNSDTRDEPGNPRSGGFYSASMTSYYDRKPARFSFREYEAEAQQYLPFFNKRRVVVLRALATATDAAPGQQVPFFMQPQLGGSHDLRGYHQSRFHDLNRVALNAEYRWEVFSGLDMAVFGDAGQVAKHVSEMRLDKFKTSYGIGFRVNTARSVFMRADLGFSRQEGRQVSINFGHVF